MVRNSLTRWSVVAGVALSFFATAQAQSRHSVGLTGPMRVGTSVVTEHADFINRYYTGTTPMGGGSSRFASWDRGSSSAHSRGFNPADGSGALGSSIYDRNSMAGRGRTAAAVLPMQKNQPDTSKTFRYDSGAGRGMRGTGMMSAVAEGTRRGDPGVPIKSYIPKLPGEARDLMEQGEALFKKGAYEKALATFQLADKVSANQMPAAQLAIMMSALAAGQDLYKLPADHLAHAFKVFPGLCVINIPPRAYMATPADYDKILAALEAHVKKTPKDAHAQFVLSYLMWRDGKKKPALEAINAALKYASDDDKKLLNGITAFVDSVQRTDRKVALPTPRMGKPISLPTVGLEITLPASFTPIRPDQAYELISAKGTVGMSKAALEHMNLLVVPAEAGENSKQFMDAALKRIAANPAISDLKEIDQAAGVIGHSMVHGRIVHFTKGKTPMQGVVMCMVRCKGLPEEAPIAYVLIATTTSTGRIQKSLLPGAVAALKSIKFTEFKRPILQPIAAGSMMTDAKFGFRQLVPHGWPARLTPEGLIAGELDYTMGGIASPLMQVSRIEVDAKLTHKEMVDKIIAKQKAAGAEPRLISQGKATLADDPNAWQFIVQQRTTVNGPISKLLSSIPAARAYVEGGRPFMHILRMVSVPSKTEGKQTVYYVSIVGFNCSAKQLKALMDPVAAGFQILKKTADTPAPKTP